MQKKVSLIILVFALHVNAGYAQFKNLKLDEQSGEGQGVCQPTIAINPRHPENIVAGSVLDNVYYSKDGGSTWSKSQLTSTFGVKGDPSIIADDKGNFYYFHVSDPASGAGGEGSRIVVQKSVDGGETWSPGESIGLNPPKYQDKQRATVDSKGNVYVAWTQFDNYGNPDPSCQSNVLFSMSKNGKKWSEPTVISQLAGNCMDNDDTPEGAIPAVTFDGKAFVAWSNQGKIFIDRSFNGGDLWLGNDITVADQVGGWDLKIPGHDRCNGMPVLITDNSKSPYRGSLYLVWADQRNGENDTDIWFTRSHNFGDNWASPMRINNDGRGKHQYLPSIAVDQETGRVYIVYYDRRDHDDNQTDVYLAYSADGGANFKNVKISETAFTPQEGRVFGDHNNISAHDGIIAPVWTRMDDGKTSIWTAIIQQDQLK